LTRDQRVEDAAPGSGEKELDSSDVVVGGLGVDGTEGDGRRDDGDEQEEGDGNGLGIEVGHFLAPPGTDCTLEVGDDSTSECFGCDFLFVATATSRVAVLDGCFIAKGASSASTGLPVAESWHDESREGNWKKSVLLF